MNNKLTSNLSGRQMQFFLIGIFTMSIFGGVAWLAQDLYAQHIALQKKRGYVAAIGSDQSTQALTYRAPLFAHRIFVSHSRSVSEEELFNEISRLLVRIAPDAPYSLDINNADAYQSFERLSVGVSVSLPVIEIIQLFDEISRHQKRLTLDRVSLVLRKNQEHDPIIDLSAEIHGYWTTNSGGDNWEGRGDDE